MYPDTDLMNVVHGCRNYLAVVLILIKEVSTLKLLYSSVLYRVVVQIWQIEKNMLVIHIQFLNKLLTQMVQFTLKFWLLLRKCK